MKKTNKCLYTKICDKLLNILRNNAKFYLSSKLSNSVIFLSMCSLMKLHSCTIRRDLIKVDLNLWFILLFPGGEVWKFLFVSWIRDGVICCYYTDQWEKGRHLFHINIHSNIVWALTHKHDSIRCSSLNFFQPMYK